LSKQTTTPTCRWVNHLLKMYSIRNRRQQRVTITSTTKNLRSGSRSRKLQTKTTIQRQERCRSCKGTTLIAVHWLLNPNRFRHLLKRK
jgi:hypothetical protein